MRAFSRGSGASAVNDRANCTTAGRELHDGRIVRARIGGRVPVTRGERRVVGQRRHDEVVAVIGIADRTLFDARIRAVPIRKRVARAAVLGDGRQRDVAARIGDERHVGRHVEDQPLLVDRLARRLDGVAEVARVDRFRARLAKHDARARTGCDRREHDGAQHAVLKRRRAGGARLLHVADAVRADRMRDAVAIDRLRREQLDLLQLLVEPHVALRDRVDAVRIVRAQRRIVVLDERAVVLQHELVHVAFERHRRFVAARGVGRLRVRRGADAERNRAGGERRAAGESGRKKQHVEHFAHHP